MLLLSLSLRSFIVYYTQLNGFISLAPIGQRPHSALQLQPAVGRRLMLHTLCKLGCELLIIVLILALAHVWVTDLDSPPFRFLLVLLF